MEVAGPLGTPLGLAQLCQEKAGGMIVATLQTESPRLREEATFGFQESWGEGKQLGNHSQGDTVVCWDSPEESACNAGGIWVQFLGWEDPLEKGMAIHSSILAWRIPWTEEPGGL